MRHYEVQFRDPCCGWEGADAHNRLTDARKSLRDIRKNDKHEGRIATEYRIIRWVGEVVE